MIVVTPQPAMIGVALQLYAAAVVMRKRIGSYVKMEYAKRVNAVKQKGGA